MTNDYAKSKFTYKVMDYSIPYGNISLVLQMEKSNPSSDWLPGNFSVEVKGKRVNGSVAITTSDGKDSTYLPQSR